MFFTGDIETGMGKCPKCGIKLHYTEMEAHGKLHFEAEKTW